MDDQQAKQAQAAEALGQAYAQVQMQHAMMLQYNEEERRRWAIEKTMHVIFSYGGKLNDAEKMAKRIENYVQFGSFDGDPL